MSILADGDDRVVIGVVAMLLICSGLWASASADEQARRIVRRSFMPGFDS